MATVEELAEQLKKICNLDTVAKAEMLVNVPVISNEAHVLSKLVAAEIAGRYQMKIADAKHLFYAAVVNSYWHLSQLIGERDLNEEDRIVKVKWQ